MIDIITTEDRPNAKSGRSSQTEVSHDNIYIYYNMIYNIKLELNCLVLRSEVQFKTITDATTLD